MPAPQVPFGAPMRHAHFAFAPTYTPLNHGSYGAHPVSVRAAHLALRAEAEAAPDPFIALQFADRLAGARARAAALLRCAVDDLVFTPNATTALDTVLMNVAWAPGDVVLCYEVLYDSVAKALAYLVETRGIAVEVVHVALPCADDALVDAMVGAARRVNARPNTRVRLAVCDTIISGPGARVPFERLVPALQAEGALVLVDGAHGVGHVALDLARLRADFFVTNLHKWLFVPRGCAALVVRRDRQPLIRTTLPTSHGFRPRAPLWGRAAAENGHHGGNGFVDMFDFTGTTDMTHWLCVEAALQFRNEVCGGEEAIRAYTQSIARRGGDLAASILGTDVMDCAGSSMRQCNFANVRLPLLMGTDDDDDEDDGMQKPGGAIPRAHGHRVSDWIKVRGCDESGIYFQTFPYYGSWWWRLSGMVYVDEADFRKGAEVLRKLCARVQRGEYLGEKPSAPGAGGRVDADEAGWDSSDDGSDGTPPDTPTSCSFH